MPVTWITSTPAACPPGEFTSCHRNWEDLVEQVFVRGIRCGFVGGSDDHRGLAGNSIPAFRGLDVSPQWHHGDLHEGVSAKSLMGGDPDREGCTQRMDVAFALALEVNGTFIGQE